MTKQAKQDVYERVTEKVIAGLEAKGLKWFCPWHKNGLAMPINNATGKAYKGINVFMLSATCQDRGFEYNEWLTYKQCADKGGQVKKGAKSEMVIFWQVSFVKDGKWFKNEADVRAAGLHISEVDKRFKVRWFNVFNIAECEGIEPRNPHTEIDPDHTVTPIEAAEAVYANYPEAKRPTLTHGGEQAFYRPSDHSVTMPQMDKFHTADGYYATLFHELVHSTGHEDCLKRDLKNGFGSDAYAKEELVAEIGSMMLVGLTGLTIKNDNQQAYVNGWISKLKNDKKLAMSAATQATKAVEFITSQN